MNGCGRDLGLGYHDMSKMLIESGTQLGFGSLLINLCHHAMSALMLTVTLPTLAEWCVIVHRSSVCCGNLWLY